VLNAELDGVIGGDGAGDADLNGKGGQIGVVMGDLVHEFEQFEIGNRGLVLRFPVDVPFTFNDLANDIQFDFIVWMILGDVCVEEAVEGLAVLVRVDGCVGRDEEFEGGGLFAVLDGVAAGTGFPFFGLRAGGLFRVGAADGGAFFLGRGSFPLLVR